MPPSRTTPRLPAPSLRALTGLLAILIFALGLLGAAPSAHDWLHAHGTEHSAQHDAHQAAPHDDAGCAVTLFAHGATPPLDLPRVIAPRPVLVSQLVTKPDNVLLNPEPHLTPPGRGPPCIG